MQPHAHADVKKCIADIIILKQKLFSEFCARTLVDKYFAL